MICCCSRALRAGWRECWGQQKTGSSPQVHRESIWLGPPICRIIDTGPAQPTSDQLQAILSALAVNLLLGNIATDRSKRSAASGTLNLPMSLLLLFASPRLLPIIQ
ncbi:hypothetical protein NX059_003182 [Plenodomus lindquistii]|nr:hypothetical protein NX059_003182 [Plenodomus lindquistii]